MLEIHLLYMLFIDCIVYTVYCKVDLVGYAPVYLVYMIFMYTVYCLFYRLIWLDMLEVLLYITYICTLLLCPLFTVYFTG